MTAQHRNTARRMKRQAQFPNPFNPQDGGSGQGGNNNGGGSTPSASNPGAGPSSPNNQSPSLTPSSSPSPNGPATTSTPNKAPTTSQDTPTTTKTTPTDSSSSTVSSTTSSTSTSSTPTTSSTSTVILTAPAQFVTTSNNLLPFTPITTAAGISSATPSPSTSAAPSSGVKVGPIVGGIAGALVGLAVLGIVTSYVLRRMRKRNRRDTIIDEDFRTSQFFGAGGSQNHNINDNDLEPPNMGERHHSFAPSFSSGPGMAGHGAYQGDNVYNAGAANAGGYGAAGYGATAYGAAGVGAAAATGAMQQRPKYTYGQQNSEEVEDMAHGVYSSQPQPQAPYNPEAYGSYASYGAGAAGGYQEATREFQGQHGAYEQHHSGPYTAQADYGVAVADPGPASSTGAAGAHPSAARDPATLSGNRAENARSVAVQDDDVYGGI